MDGVGELHGGAFKNGNDAQKRHHRLLASLPRLPSSRRLVQQSAPFKMNSLKSTEHMSSSAVWLTIGAVGADSFER